MMQLMSPGTMYPTFSPSGPVGSGDRAGSETRDLSYRRFHNRTVFVSDIFNSSLLASGTLR